MVGFGGKKAGQMFRGNGVGHILAAAAFTLLVRLFSGPGAVLLPESENEDYSDEEEMDAEDGEDPVTGKVFPVTIRWSNINCSSSDKSSDSVKFLLKNVSGEAKPGRLLAIMGPSGSGKTTLLELTVRETLSLSTELQLPVMSSVEERDEFVNNLLSKLGLVSCADTIVGDAKVHGISGGEKKRLTLACELITRPSVIFADEPTAGLDAFQAEKVMETLQQLALDGHTVICSIHQPRGSVYSKFDDIVLLTEGSLVYAGPAGDELLAYFSKFGYPCSDHVNPAEFFADLVSIDYSSAESVYSSQKRIDGLVESFSQRIPTIIYATPITREELSKVGIKISKRTVAKKKGGWWRQFWLLLKRAWMQAFRDGQTNQLWAKMSFTSAILFGSVFWKMGRSQTSIQDRMGLLQVAAINTAVSALTKILGVFPKERAIVDRELIKGSYALGPYLLSKLLVEIPIGAVFPLLFGAVLYPMAHLHPTLLRFEKFCGIVTVESLAASALGLTVGAMVPTTEAAMAVGPSLMTVFIVFGGYFVNPENTPIIFHWIPHVSLIRWAFQGLCINEFSDLQFDHQHPFDVQTGEQVLQRISFSGYTIRDTVIAQSKILLFWYGTTYLLLQINKPKYQKLEPPHVYHSNSHVKLEELDFEHVEQPLEPSKKQLESPEIDLIGPFILDGF
ncbi:ABC transporter G family member 7 [Senna tora]|uniref:ABC transporter G family member 7 n=1 Tax=Senna tora TaxID=362788 RepID=A0A834W503_9FABA|nr:ABC transporter G family member 7 [Senna tora]